MELNKNQELLELDKLIDKVEEEVNKFSKTSEYSLSMEFKNALKEAFPDYTFYFYERTLRVDTPSGQNIYVSNQSFALASRLMVYCEEIGKYRSIARNILYANKDKLQSVVHQSGKLEDDVFTELREQNNNTLKNEFENETKAYFQTAGLQSEELIDKNTERLMNFVTNYKWWLGGKQISRSNDWAISPISTLLNMPQNDSNFVARAASKATEDSDYRKAFAQAVDYEWTVDSEVNSSLSVEQENPEERNKRLFRYWMKMQVKPEGDSDAGNPYSEASIDQYVNNIANTPSPSAEGKSLFATTDEGEVNFTIDVLDNAEKKNNTQRSAVRKYLQYVQMLDNDNENIFNHELFGMHIKEKNDALSEENPHVCIGWSNLGDLSDIDSKEQLSELYEANYDKNNRGRGQDVGQIWRFIHDMKVGDYVIFAENSVFHIGRIESDYCYDTTERESQDSDYKSNRKVKWLKKNISRNVLSTNLHNSLKTAMSIWTLNDYKSAVLDLLRGTYAKDGDIDMASEYIEPVYNTDLSVKYERNRIVFGAPGTGKSFRLKNDCEELMEKTSGTYERVTFHPDYSYSQFVGTYKPVMGEDNNSIRYDFVAGPFMRVYVDAIKSGRTESPKAHLLLIEEINRAKVAAVFGDVFQLLDRDDDGVSEYEIQVSEDIRRYLAKNLGGFPENYNKIRIPNNMFIWATMNSADQGVFPMDTAFKRRWNFEYLGINESEKDIIGVGKIVLPGETDAVEWNAVRRAINDRMASEYRINEDKLMGPFFLAKKVIASDENGMIIDTEKFMDAFKSKVIMYLYEDAVKQRKHDFFNGCDSSKYSSVCEAFEEKGMAIFGTSVKNAVYNK